MARYSLSRYGVRLVPKNMTMEGRFWEKVAVTSADECWLWQGAKRTVGYGILSVPNVKGFDVYAHRYSAMLHFGMFHKKLHVLHQCGVRACVNPRHLYLGDDADNMKDTLRHGTWRNQYGPLKRGIERGHGT